MDLSLFAAGGGAKKTNLVSRPLHATLITPRYCRSLVSNVPFRLSLHVEMFFAFVWVHGFTARFPPKPYKTNAILSCASANVPFCVSGDVRSAEKHPMLFPIRTDMSSSDDHLVETRPSTRSPSSAWPPS